MNRRQFLKATAATTLAPVLTGPLAAASAKRPNILFIMTDQQSATMLSCTGNKWLKTPALDSIAAAGIRFERAYAANPVCIPNRFSLQTGLYPNTIGMGRNEDSPRTTVTDRMIAESLGNLFKNAGYETAYGGKVHLPKRMNDLAAMGYARHVPGGSRQALADSCAEFFSEPHNRPFLLFASFINPHDICYMGINDHARVTGGKPIGNLDSKTCEQTLDIARNSRDLHAFIEANCPPLPPNHAIPALEPEAVTTKYTMVRPFRQYLRDKYTADQWRLHRWAYHRLTERVDAQIGVVLDALRKSPFASNTLVVFTSDHGDMDSAHKMEHKSVLYEEALRIPFLMSFPGRIPAGRIDDTHLICNGLDLLPTLCDYAGIDAPSHLTGRSVRPLAEGARDTVWRRHLVAESQNSRMIRTDRYKYYIYDSGRNPECLIDVETDPGEMNNLAYDPKYKQILDKHRKLMQNHVRQSGDKIAAQYVTT